MNVAVYIISALVIIALIRTVSVSLRKRSRDIQIIGERCTGCQKCLKSCRHGVLEAVKDEKVHVIVRQPEKCTFCADCARVCKFDAIEFIVKK